MVVLLVVALVADVDAPGRVAHLAGDIEARGLYDERAVALSQNAAVQSGDELVTPLGSFAELELRRGVFVRMAGGTRVVVDELAAQLRIILAEGVVVVTRERAAPAVTLVALGSEAQLHPGSVLRVDLDRQRLTTEMRSVEGVTSVLVGREKERLERNQMLVLFPGARERSTWDRQPDAFDTWVGERALRVAQVPDHLSSVSYVGAYELVGHGRWIQINGQWMWRPKVAASWRPFSQGSWSWVEPHGWVWVSNVGWGYVTHHYGRWVYRADFGWVWQPGADWGPAWVAWVVAGTYVGWAPIGYDLRHHHHYWTFFDLGYFYYGGGHHHHGHDRGHGGDHGDSKLAKEVALSLARLAQLNPQPVDPETDRAPTREGKANNLLAKRMRDTNQRRLAAAQDAQENAPRWRKTPKRPSPPRPSARRAKRYSGVSSVSIYPERRKRGSTPASARPPRSSGRSRVAAPPMPAAPSAPSIPAAPSAPSIPAAPSAPSMPAAPSTPSMPAPSAPSAPHAPKVLPPAFVPRTPSTPPALSAPRVSPRGHSSSPRVSSPVRHSSPSSSSRSSSSRPSSSVRSRPTASPPPAVSAPRRSSPPPPPPKKAASSEDKKSSSKKRRR